MSAHPEAEGVQLDRHDGVIVRQQGQQIAPQLWMQKVQRLRSGESLERVLYVAVQPVAWQQSENRTLVKVLQRTMTHDPHQVRTVRSVRGQTSHL